MTDSATDMLISAGMDFLRRHAPFDRMEPEALRFLLERARLAYYPADAQIVSPERGVVETFYILQRGKVLARQAGDVNVVDYSTMTLGPGECFPIGSVTGRRASTNLYVALDDVFCYELPAGDFFELMQRSAVFNLHCTQYIASLLNQSRQQLQVQFAQRAAEQQTMNSPLSSIVKRAPVSVPPGTTIRGVIATMVDSHLGSMIVTDGEQKPIGIFTQSDVLKRVVLSGVSLDEPISAIMSADPHTLPLASNAYDAALAMAMHGVRHVLAVDEGGRLKGVVSERDLFTLQRVGLRQIRQSIDRAADLETLCQAASDVRQLATNMLAQGVGAEQLTQFVSALNDTLTRRIVELNLERHDLEGIDWAWLSFGSEGRDEQTFSTDQDNGIVYVCTDMMDREQTQLRLLDFAREVNADLDKVGFPLCKGNIMASNPELCLTIEEWENKFADWVRTPEPEALLNATIFFDFRPLTGKFHLAHRLRLTLFQQVRGNPLFMRMMAQNALSVQPPLGKIRDFITDAEPEHPGAIDLKKSGARLFVDAARIFALAQGVPNTNTVQRLKLASAKLNVNANEVASVIEGFSFIQLLRLRHQHFEQEQGRPGDNYVKPDRLNELERRILKESFRQVRKLQQRLKLDYQL
ncbi:MAG: CBS domain-containing protein [Betaproteobacteria bacterium]|nr:CBS domain-containing protein [Betaproteobacteria bacterium]